MLEWTGERFLPEAGAQIAYEHYSRYLYAQSFVEGKVVLDCPSGEGFGSNILANKALSVQGLDIAQEAVNHSRENYKRSNLKFDLGDMTDLSSWPNGHFDVIVCMEGIEHVSEEKQILALHEFKRVLKADGKLLISTPNKRVYTDLSGVKNEYHEKEFYLDEYRTFLKQHFKQIKVLGQSIVSACPILDIEGSQVEPLKVSFFGSEKEIETPRGQLEDVWWYFIAVCTDGTEPIPLGSVFIDFQKRTEKETIKRYQDELDRIHLVKGSLEQKILFLEKEIYKRHIFKRAVNFLKRKLRN